jgi:hypothetical protein
MDLTLLIQLLALVLTSLALVPAMAHVLELPNKLAMSRETYLTVQRMYRGWDFLEFIVIGAMITTLILVITADDAAFAPALIAFFAIAATQVVFWTFTFPVNRRTENWTLTPEEWEPLRDRWELSHAASAVLNFIALVCVALAILRG